MLRNIIDYIFLEIKFLFLPLNSIFPMELMIIFLLKPGLLTLKPKQIGDLEPLIGAWKEDIVLNISYIVLCNYL